MRHSLVRISMLGCVLFASACPAPTPTTTDPLRRKFTVEEHGGVDAAVTRTCPVERRRGGSALSNNGETLVIGNCNGAVTTFAAAGDLGKLGAIDLKTVPESAMAQGKAEAVARGLENTNVDVRRLVAIGASEIVVLHQAGYDVVDVSDPSAPTWSRGRLLMRTAGATAINTLRRQALPGKTGRDEYTLERTARLGPFGIDGGCVIDDRFVVLALTGSEPASRTSPLTGLIASDDPLSIGGAQVFDLSNGALVAHLAGANFGPRSCDTNDNGLVMFNDEEDSGVYPYTIDIFAQLGFREYFGAVFERVAEVFGSAVEVSGGALGVVIDSVTTSGETAGEAAGTPAAYATISKALEVKLTLNASTIGGATALQVNTSGCTNASAVQGAITACVAEQVGLIAVDPTNPEDILTDIETAATNAATALGNAPTGCAATLDLSGCTAGAGIITEAATKAGEVMQFFLFDPVFKLSTADTLTAMNELAIDPSTVNGPGNVFDDTDPPADSQCAPDLSAMDKTAFKTVAQTCATEHFTDFTATSFDDALTQLDPAGPGSALLAFAGCMQTSLGMGSVPGVVGCSGSAVTDAVTDATNAVGQQSLFALYTQFGFVAANAVGTRVGELVGGAAVGAPGAMSAPDAATAVPILEAAGEAGFADAIVAGSGPTNPGEIYFAESNASMPIRNAAAAAAASVTAAQTELVNATDLVFRSLATDDEVWNAGPLRAMLWDEYGATSRFESDAMNYAAFESMPPAGDDFLNKYSVDLVNPRRGAKYVKVFGTRYDGATDADDKSLRGMRALAYVMATSECFDMNKQWNAPRSLSDGPMRAGAKPDVPALLNPLNLQAGGTTDGDLENPDAMIPLYTFNVGTNAWFAGTAPALGGDGSDGFMGSIASLHKVAWDTWIDRDPSIAGADKATVKSYVTGTAPALNEAIDPAFQCTTDADFASPHWQCMLCQARFIDLLSLKLDTRPTTDPNAKVACTIKYGSTRVTSTPSCTGRNPALTPGVKPRPIEFDNGATTINGGDVLVVDNAKSKLTVTPVGGAQVDASWDCTCEGTASTLQCDANGNVVCLANLDFNVNTKTPAEAPTSYAELGAYTTALNQHSQGTFGKMHLVDLSRLRDNQSIALTTKPPTFAELTPTDTPSQWDLSSRNVRKGRAFATAANPVKVDDTWGTPSSDLVIHTRIFTNGVDSMVDMPGTQHFLGIEGPEGWDLFDVRDMAPGCESTTNPDFGSSCFYNATHFGFAIVPQAKAFLSGVLSEEQAGEIASALYLFDQDPLPVLAEPFVNVNGGAAVGIDARTILLAEGASTGGNVWIYDVQTLTDQTGEPIQVFKEALAPGYFLGSAVADRANNRVFVIGYARENTAPEDLKVFRITNDVAYEK